MILFLLVALPLLIPLQQGDLVEVTIGTRDSDIVKGTATLGELKIECSLGTVDLKVADISRIDFLDGVTVYTNDGSTLRGKMKFDSVTIKAKIGEFTIKRADLVTITIHGVVAPPKPSREPRPRPGAVPIETTPTPGPTPPAAPLQKLDLNAEVTRIIRSPDRKLLYVLNLTGSKLLGVDAGSLESKSELPLMEGARFASLSPSGETLFVASRKAIGLISLKSWKLAKTFQVERDIEDLGALDDEHVLAIVPGTGTPLVVFSATKQAAILTVDRSYGAGAPFVPSPDGRRIYCPGGYVVLPARGKGFDALTWQQLDSTRQLSQHFVLSPDGRYGLSEHGTVFRMGKSQVADAVPFGKVEQCTAAAFSESGRSLYTFIPTGVLKEYDGETLKPARSAALGLFVHMAIANETEGSVTLFADTLVSGQPHRRPPGGGNIGDLFKVELPK